MTAPISILQDSLTVTPAEDGRVAVTVLLPPDLVRDYCRLLESLAGFFQFAQKKSFTATLESRASVRSAEAEAAVSAYSFRIVAEYDRLTAGGVPRSDAIRLIAADLRAKSHPWSAPHLVRAQLIASGRSGRSGRPARRSLAPRCAAPGATGGGGPADSITHGGNLESR